MMQNPVNDTLLQPELKVERPKLHKVILVNDDFTPREFVTLVLKAEFRLNEAKARQIMMTAHKRGVCVVSVFTREIAEEKATAGTDAARRSSPPNPKNKRPSVPPASLPFGQTPRHIRACRSPKP